MATYNDDEYFPTHLTIYRILVNQIIFAIIIDINKEFRNRHTMDIYRLYINGLQVNGGGVFDREFTKSLIIRDFDDVLQNPFR